MTRHPSPWPHRLAVVTAVTTLLLIFVGGLVTNTGSALAVPDWPTTFGQNMFLYPWSRMVGGIFYEHSHRLIGSAVGMLTIVFAVSLWLTEPRAWVRRLGIVAVAAVGVQGVLGGLRVVLLEHGLAIIHGCVAQAFFALMISLVACTSRQWQAIDDAPPPRDAKLLRALAVATTAAVYLQIVFGALLTHTGTRLDAHLLGAGLVLVCGALLGGRVLAEHAARAELRRPGVLLLVLLCVQLSLGLVTLLQRLSLLGASLPAAVSLGLPTTHRLTGALLLGTSMVLLLRVFRVTASRQAETERPPVMPLVRSFGPEQRRQVTA